MRRTAKKGWRQSGQQRPPFIRQSRSAQPTHNPLPGYGRFMLVRSNFDDVTIFQQKPQEDGENNCGVRS
jgi:hypothetical protein